MPPKKPSQPGETPQPEPTPTPEIRPDPAPGPEDPPAPNPYPEEPSPPSAPEIPVIKGTAWVMDPADFDLPFSLN